MILDSRLKEIMDAEGLNKVQFAKTLGIARVTLDKILNNEWEQIQRKTIVKLCEHLGKGIGEIFYLKSETIWGRLEETGHVNIIVGGRTSDVYKNIPDEGIHRVALGYWDMQAWSQLVPELHSEASGKFTFDLHVFPSHVTEGRHLSTDDKNRADKLLESGDTCLIIGSSKVNPIFNLCYETIIKSQESKNCIPPYEFRWVPPEGVEVKNSFSLIAVKKFTEQGIYSAVENITLPITPRNAIRQKINCELSDAGIIILCLNYENTNTTVIGFGGLGGTATLGCVRAFLKQKEDLDTLVRVLYPKSLIKPVFVTFRKRTDTTYDDRYLTGADIMIKDKDFIFAVKGCN